MVFFRTRGHRHRTRGQGGHRQRTRGQGDQHVLSNEGRKMSHRKGLEGVFL